MRITGDWNLSDLLQPAIHYARNGYAVAPRVQHDWTGQSELLSADSNTRSVFMPGGKAPKVGDLHFQPALAATLERIAEKGRDGFYEGSVAEDIVEYLEWNGWITYA
ncbi:MAG: gamma-glutamyltransferase [Halofilum sp. (in: g-proteobacteria)]|nr:gamma-glutamyltransferase [Halofilum sp. (in: g-proteobacteria)]